MTKLTELFESLNRKEKKELYDYLQSPYYNKNKSIATLFDIIKETESLNISDIHTREKLFSKIYPGVKYKSKQFDLLVSQLVKQINYFLAVKSSQKENETVQLFLLHELRERKLLKNFKSEAKKLRTALKQKSAMCSEDYLNLSQVEHEIIISNLNKIFLTKNTKYQDSIDNLDYFFILRKLLQAVYIYNHRNEVGKDLKYRLYFLEEIQEFIRQNLQEIKRNHPVIFCYYLVLLMLQKPENEQSYSELKKYVWSYTQKIRQNVLWDILIEMKNYADNMVRLNREKYIRETFEIYRLLEQNDYFKKQIFINHFDFLNTATVGLLLKEFKWVQKFITLYKNKLSSASKSITLGVLTAEINFLKGDYSSALACLNSLNYENYYFYLRIKILMIKIYYDMNEAETLHYTLDALKHYLKRNERILGRYIEVVKNFIHYIGLLVKFRQNNMSAPNRQNLSNIREEVTRQSSLLSKEWLIEKIDEFNK